MSGISIDLVLHIEIIEQCDTNKRQGFLLDMLGSTGSTQQQVLNDFVLHVVTDGHLGMDDDAVVMCRSRIIRGLRTHQVGVGNGDNLVLTGTNASHQCSLLEHKALHIAKAYEIALVEGAPMIEVEPSDTMTPKNTDTPWNTSELELGSNGHIMTNINE